MSVVDTAEPWALDRNVIPSNEPWGTRQRYKENEIRGTLLVCSDQQKKQKERNAELRKLVSYILVPPEDRRLRSLSRSFQHRGAQRNVHGSVAWKPPGSESPL